MCSGCQQRAVYCRGLCEACYQDDYRRRRWEIRRDGLARRVERVIVPLLRRKAPAREIATAAVELLAAPKPRANRRKRDDERAAA